MYPVTDAAEEAKVEDNTAVAAYQWLREVCSTKLLSLPIKLGGSGVIVQIDESLFRHKPKVFTSMDMYNVQCFDQYTFILVSSWQGNK